MKFCLHRSLGLRYSRLTPPIDEIHELLAEVSGIRSLFQSLHDQVGLRVWKVLVEGEHHVEEGIRELFFEVFAERILNAVQKEHHIVHIPLV